MHVGMNLFILIFVDVHNRVPHARGDEPFSSTLLAVILRVPHARGDEPIMLKFER